MILTNGVIGKKKTITGGYVSCDLFIFWNIILFLNVNRNCIRFNMKEKFGHIYQLPFKIIHNIGRYDLALQRL